MNIFGWVFLAFSWSIIALLLSYCLYRLLFSKKV